MGSYASLIELKARLRIIDATDDALLTAVLLASSRAIDAYCARSFELAGVVSPRIFFPLSNILQIHDAAEVTAIANSGAPIDAANWRLLPSNNLALGRPYTAVQLHTGSWGGPYTAGISVTARWGWPAIPAGVAEATLLQAGRLYKRKDSPLGVAGVEGEGAIRLGSLDPDLRLLLMTFRRWPVG